MISTPNHETQEIVDQVRQWPLDQRIALIEKLQELCRSTEDVAPKRTPIGNLRGLLRLQGVDPPDDAQVRQWLEERRMQKFGG
ncbi:MAG: hypothetical protein R3C02_16585 [Planctomycetaceae bacterium]